MKKKVVLFGVVLLLFGLVLLRANHKIGISTQAMFRENEAAAQGWICRDSMGDSMAVFLQFSTAEEGADIDVYAKRQGTIGWFFRYGGTSAGWMKNLEKLTLEGNSEYILLNRSDLTVSRIEIDKGNGTTVTIAPEPGRPFAYVMDESWLVAVYGADGIVLQPVVYRM